MTPAAKKDNITLITHAKCQNVKQNSVQFFVDKVFLLFVIPYPKKDYKRCALWIHNLGNLKLEIKTFTYSPDKIVCEKHFEISCFKEDMQVSFF